MALSKEIVDLAREITNGIDQQDNRCTASPYFYVVQEKRERIAPEGCGDESRFLDMTHGDTEPATRAELVERYGSDSDEWPSTVERYDISHVWETPENHNVFFTDAAVRKHMETNRHHWPGEIRSYVRHAYRNPEMAAVMRILRAVSDTDHGTEEP